MPQAPRPALSTESDELLGIPRGAALLVIAVVLAKVALIGTVLAVDFSWTSGLFVLITTWFWVALGAVVLAGPILYAIRVRRVRARRNALQRAEWMES